MTSYASRSAYEFTESPQSTPVRPTKPATPAPATPVEDTPTPSKTAAFSSFLSNKWGSFAAKATEVAQRARGALHDYVGNEASSTIGDDVWSQDLAYAPWDCLGSLDGNTAKELKQLILNIADNPRHLVNVPPDEQSFNLDDWLPVAIAALKQDEKLREARTSLVPKDLDEEAFWRSYFFRVNLLKRAFGVTELPQLKEGTKLPEPQKMRTSLANSSSSQATRESSPDLSSSNSSIALPSIDELLPSDDSDDSDGLVGESDEEILEPRSLALEFGEPDDDTPDANDGHGTYDIEKDEHWKMHNEFSTVEPFHVAVPDHILKALED